MMRVSMVLAAALMAAQGAVAQTDGAIEITPLDVPSFDLNDPETTDRDAVELARGAVLRALDKVSGEVRELEMSSGDSVTVGRIEIALGECRYPSGNPSGDAFAWVEVRSPARESTDFAGWMIASSPALNALDHARYDVWVMRCIST